MKNYFKYLCILSLYFTNICEAYLTNSESAELVPENQFRVTLEPQVNYFAVNSHLDFGVSEDSQVRLSAGIGGTGYNFDFFFKRVPYPDYDKQPAMGYKIGASFMMDQKKEMVLTPIIAPLISKNLIIKKDKWTPYISLPIGVSVHRSATTTPVHFVAGVELTPSSVENMQFGGEIGLNVKDSFTYVSGYVSFYFEPTEQVIDN
jgi:hypothetical protein